MKRGDRLRRARLAAAALTDGAPRCSPRVLAS